MQIRLRLGNIKWQKCIFKLKFAVYGLYHTLVLLANQMARLLWVISHNPQSMKGRTPSIRGGGARPSCLLIGRSIHNNQHRPTRGLKSNGKGHP